MNPVRLQVEAEGRVLREMVEAEDFEGAQKAMERYVALLRDNLDRVGPDEAMALLDEARGLVEWAKRNLRASRARLAGDKERLQQVGQYRAPHGGRGHRVRVDG